MSSPATTPFQHDASPAAAAAPAARDAAATTRADAGLTVTVHDSFEAAKPDWLALEATGVLTPYQQYGWITAWHAARGAKGRLALVVIRAADGPVALLPLEIGRKAGLRRATIIGAEIGNSDWMILRREAAPLLTRETLLALLREAAQQAGGFDLISLYDQPQEWDGLANPLLAFPHQPGPDHFFFAARGQTPSFDRFDAKRLANFKRRQRKLAEAHGTVEFRTATTPDEIDAVHAAFLEQRGARFAQQGIANIFGQPDFVRFFRAGAIASLGTGERPAMLFQALYAGDEIVATSFGTFCGAHYSQYINSTAAGEVAKFRLIGLLMQELFADCARRGATSIDMGLGDFDYKTDWTEPVSAYDGMIPLTAAGRLGGSAILMARRLKRMIKQHDALWSAAKKLRALLAGQRPGPTA